MECNDAGEAKDRKVGECQRAQHHKQLLAIFHFNKEKVSSDNHMSGEPVYFVWNN